MKLKMRGKNMTKGMVCSFIDIVCIQQRRDRDLRAELSKRKLQRKINRSIVAEKGRQFVQCLQMHVIPLLSCKLFVVGIVLLKQ